MFEGGEGRHDCCDFFCGGRAVFCCCVDMLVFCGLITCDIYVDECAQAVVLAEVAARVFVAGGAVSNVGYGFEAYEGCLLAVGP